eukprot:15475664-Alexandrium_andersonii.AAC.1
MALSSPCCLLPSPPAAYWQVSWCASCVAQLVLRVWDAAQLAFAYTLPCRTRCCCRIRCSAAAS